MNQYTSRLATLLLSPLVAAAVLGAPVNAQSPFPYLDPNSAGLTFGSSSIFGQVNSSQACDLNLLSAGAGFYGQYFNLAIDDAGMPHGEQITAQEGLNYYWYRAQNLFLEKIDSDLNFRSSFLPLNEGKAGDPFYFAVHWRAAVYIPKDNTYSFSMTSDDDSWLFINNQLVIDLSGIHSSRTGRGSIKLNAGLYEINIFYAERAPTGAVFVLHSGQKLQFTPLPPGCSLNQSAVVKKINAAAPASAAEPPAGRVLGAQTAAPNYTPAIALYRAKGSPDIYAIYANGFRHYISGPTAFQKYGYKYNEVKTVSRAALDKYPDARLLRAPDDPMVYFISARTTKQWLKIPLNSPTVFVSYTDNAWGNLIIVDGLDIIAYPDVRLIKTKNDPNIYLLNGNIRRPFVSREIIEGLGYNTAEVMEISEAHLKSFLPGEPIG